MEAVTQLELFTSSFSRSIVRTEQLPCRTSQYTALSP